MRKKLMVRVLPGVELVFASPRRLSRVLIREDLPTLDRPTKATSGPTSAGYWAGVTALVTNSADVILITHLLVHGDPGEQLRIEIGRFARHTLAGLSVLDDLFHACGIQQQRYLILLASHEVQGCPIILCEGDRIFPDIDPQRLLQQQIMQKADVKCRSVLITRSYR